MIFNRVLEILYIVVVDVIFYIVIIYKGLFLKNIVKVNKLIYGLNFFLVCKRNLNLKIMY